MRSWAQIEALGFDDRSKFLPVRVLLVLEIHSMYTIDRSGYGCGYIRGALDFLRKKRTQAVRPNIEATCLARNIARCCCTVTSKTSIRGRRLQLVLALG